MVEQWLKIAAIVTERNAPQMAHKSCLDVLHQDFIRTADAGSLAAAARTLVDALENESRDALAA